MLAPTTYSKDLFGNHMRSHSRHSRSFTEPLVSSSRLQYLAIRPYTHPD